MLILNINGGLGNQMFQYAFGLYLSLKYDRQITFDLGDLTKNQLRNLELDSFKIELSPAPLNLVKKFKKSRFAKVNYVLNQLLFNGKNYFYEPKVNDQIIAPGVSYYWGYWQNPQYIIEIEQKIREHFILKNPLNESATLYQEKILKTDGESISLHIRKSDYLLHKNNFLASCEADYYYEAINTILKMRGSKLHFFIFSDDFAWVRDNLQFQDISYTYINPTVQHKPSEDLYLMSICNHNIIANSTFSWWAAYLNFNKNKIVISPKFWFRNRKKKNINLDDWIEIENE